MKLWAHTYRTQMLQVAKPIAAIEASPYVGRSTCNDLLTTTYNAQSELQRAPDPDIDESLRKALDNFAEGGTFCLQEQNGLRDTYLLLGKSGITLMEALLSERYSEQGVPGLAEPPEGGSAIGRRAVEFASNLKGQ
ncbi:MAG TPA: hypothetical protein VF179_00890 [Thermoanaerobaculia bacterium]|nr:hypothetical protein [Thermoanaerobaculia bacterium]